MHKRNLPHIYPPEAAFFITFRLKNSIPREVLAKMKEDEEQRIAEIRQSKLSEAEKEEAIYVEKKRFFSRSNRPNRLRCKPMARWFVSGIGADSPRRTKSKIGSAERNSGELSVLCLKGVIF